MEKNSFKFPSFRFSSYRRTCSWPSSRAQRIQEAGPQRAPRAGRVPLTSQPRPPGPTAFKERRELGPGKRASGCSSGGAHCHVPAGEPEGGQPRGRTAPQRAVLRGRGRAGRPRGGGASRTRRLGSCCRRPRHPRAVRAGSEMHPRTLPPLRQRPLTAVETTPAPFV